MSLADLMSRTVTIIHQAPGAEDGYGNKPLEETDREDVRAYIEQTAATEIAVGRDVQISDHLIVLPVGTVVGGDDLISFDGLTLEIVGPPARPHTPRGESHVEVRGRVIG